MSWSQTVVVFWIQFAIAAAVLLQVGRLVVRRLNQPADRIRVIEFAMLAVLLIPLSICLSPAPLWSLPLIAPANEHSTKVKEIEPSAGPPPANAIAERSGHALERHDREAVAESTPRNASATLDPSQVSMVSASADSSDQAVHEQQTGISRWAVLAVAICIVHALAAIYLIIEWLAGTYSLRALCRRALPVDQEMMETWFQITEGQGRHVRLLLSPSVDSPLMYGELRPTVILPIEMAESNRDELAFCLAHEWSHIRRHDMAAWNFVRGCQCLLWFQPTYWALREELRLQQDILADNCATSAKNDAVDYSELLLGFVRTRMARPNAAALTFLDRPTQLLKRIKMLLENPMTIRARSSWKFSIVVGSLALLSTFVLSGIRLESTQANDGANPKSTKSDSNQSSTTPNDGNVKDPAPQTIGKAPGAMKFQCRVVDRETDQGIPGVKVSVYWNEALDDGGFRPIQQSVSITDSNGGYTLDVPDVPLADENVELSFDLQHDDYANSGYGNTLKAIRDKESLENRPGFERMRVNRAELVTGTVVSPEGQPLSDITVAAFDGLSDRTTTDEKGQFRLKLKKNKDAVFWVFPREYAIVEKYLAKQRGDIGTIKLNPGVRVSGRLVGIKGEPIPNVPVNIRLSGRPVFQNVLVQSSVHRGVLTDAEGRFAFAPLPAGEYNLNPDQRLEDPLPPKDGVAIWQAGDPHYRIPVAFAPKTLVIKEGSPDISVEFNALPTVYVNVQVVDGAGRKVDGSEFRRVGGHPFIISGELDGRHWYAWARPDQTGRFHVPVPHGLQNGRLQILGTPRTSFVLRIRTGKDKPLEHVGITQLGTLNDDVDGIEIVRYRPGVVTVSVVDEEQKPIENPKMESAYQSVSRAQYIFSGESRSDVHFEKMPDGRLRSFLMFPDEEVALKATANGYEPASEKINVGEGQTKEIVLTLKKAGG